MRLRDARVDTEAEAVHRLRLGRGRAGEARFVRVRGSELRRARARDERGVEVPVAVQREPDALAAARAALHQIRDREVAASEHIAHTRTVHAEQIASHLRFKEASWLEHLLQRVQYG